MFKRDGAFDLYLVKYYDHRKMKKCNSTKTSLLEIKLIDVLGM